MCIRDRGRTIDGDNYVISHLAGKEENDPPVHIIGFSQDLDRRSETGRPRLAAHALVQAVSYTHLPSMCCH